MTISDETYVRTQRVRIPEGVSPEYLFRAIVNRTGLVAVIRPGNSQDDLVYKVIVGAKQPPAQPHEGAKTAAEIEIELLFNIVPRVPALTLEQVEQWREGQFNPFGFPFTEYDLNLTPRGAEYISPKLIERVEAVFRGVRRRFVTLPLYHAIDRVERVLYL